MIHRFRRMPTLLACTLLTGVWLGGCATSHATRSPAGSPPASAREAADAYTRLGMAYLRRNDPGRAQQALDHALAMANDDPDALQGLALLYQRQGEADAAERYFQRALDAGDGAPRIRNNYAAFLFASGRTAQACDQLEQASQDLHYDRRARLLANLGQCRQRLGQDQRALQAWQRAQAIDPGLARSYLAIAELSYQFGNSSMAMQQLAQYEHLAGPTDDSRRLRRELFDQPGHADSDARFIPSPSQRPESVIDAPATNNP